MRSVRARITTLATVVVIAVLVVVGLVLVRVQEGRITESINDSLEVRAADLMFSAGSEGDLASAVSLPGDDDSIAQLMTLDGRVIASSPTIESAGPIGDPTDLGTRATEVPGTSGPYRVLIQPVPSADGGEEVVLAFGVSLDDVREGTQVLARSLAVAIPVVAVLMAGLVWILVGRTLRPVEAIRLEVSDISGSDLHRRVPEPGNGDEIDRLACTMNAMLERVEQSSARQRQFVADASHELRTPLTRVRTELEVDLANPDPPEVEPILRSLLEEAIALERMVDGLLQLARADDAPTNAVALLDLEEIVLAEVEGQYDVAVGGAEVTYDIAGVAPAAINGDRGQIARAIRNVLDNATRHAATKVEVTLTDDGDKATLEIGDDGAGVPLSSAEIIFERFGRADDARTRDSGGAGLGLAIAREILDHHQGTIELLSPVDGDTPEVGGARFRLRMPSGDRTTRRQPSRT